MKRKHYSVTALILSFTLLLALSACADRNFYATGDPEPTSRFQTISTVDGKGGVWYLHTEDAYEYPFTPMNDPVGWVKRPDDRLVKQNLPETVLKNISTAGLVETAFNNVFYSDYEYAEYPYELALTTFLLLNSGTELLARKDAPEQFTLFYLRMNLRELLKMHDLEDGSFSKQGYIEYVISSPGILGNMTSEMRQALILRVYMNVLINDEDGRHSMGYKPGALLLGRLVCAESSEFREYLLTDDVLNTFIKVGDLPRGETSPAYYRSAIDTIAAFWEMRGLE